MSRALVLLAAAASADAACPGAGGHSAHDRCWYLSDAGVSCGDTCKARGLTYSHFVAGEAAPIVPKLLGREPATKQFSWGRIECYVASGDRYHPARPVQQSNTGDNGEPQDWKGEGVCQLACPCSAPAAAAPPANLNAPYPGCVQQGQVYRHAGAHAIFVDMSGGGSAGCWQNDCTHTDKFNSVDMGICARMCSQNDDCTHWSYGEQDGAKKCFFRKSDAGQEAAEGWVSAPKGCTPTAIPDAVLAAKAAELLLPCDGGKNEACPDMARAVTTWKFAIKHLKRAAEGKLDANTVGFVNQVAGDTDAFAAQMSEENFPVVAANNRQVFQALGAWLGSQGTAPVNAADASLPSPLRGKLCGPSHCYEEL